MALYMVELQLAGISSERLDAVSAALFEACHRSALGGTKVTFLSGTFVSGTGRCWCLFDADSPGAVRQVNDLAQLPLVSIETAQEVPTWATDGSTIGNLTDRREGVDSRSSDQYMCDL